mgnify:CR=1 FL=1
MDAIQKHASDNLRILEQDLPEPWFTTTNIDTKSNTNNTITTTTTAANYINNMVLLLGHLLSVGGDHCDGCHKTPAELGMEHLKACARCQRAFYCCGDCQAKQWKADHK